MELEKLAHFHSELTCSVKRPWATNQIQVDNRGYTDRRYILFSL